MATFGNILERRGGSAMTPHVITLTLALPDKQGGPPIVDSYEVALLPVSIPKQSRAIRAAEQYIKDRQELGLGDAPQPKDELLFRFFLEAMRDPAELRKAFVESKNVDAFRESLIGEKQKLVALSVEKSEEIKRLYDTIKRMKDAADAERAELKAIVGGLRAGLRENERRAQEELELLKVKMAQLHRADVESLESFYENEVAGLQTEVATLREGQRSDREKLYGLLQENDELRKNFEVEISKQKAKIQDMKVKYAAARLEFKEQITSLGTKMELTSQSLIRETQQKQKGA